MNTAPVSHGVAGLLDTDVSQSIGHSKYVDMQAQDNTVSGFAATLASMLGIPVTSLQALQQPKQAQGMDSELEQAAGETTGNAVSDGKKFGNDTVASNERAGSRGSDRTRTAFTAISSAATTAVATTTTTGVASTVPTVATAATTTPVITTTVASETNTTDGVPTTATSNASAVDTSVSLFERAANVRATASANATNTINTVNTDTDALNPEFRARLGRVMTRMQEEYGHSAQIVEGFRLQGRQNYLYEQGRTRPGDVVTWTKSSKHTLGLAADLQIDGTYDNPAAYQHLAHIAAQEGLRTLGTRDPGHVELPSRASAAAWGAPAPTVRSGENLSRAVGLVLAQSGNNDEEPVPSSLSRNVDNLNSFMSREGRSAGENAMVMRVGQQSQFGGQLDSQLSDGQPHAGFGGNAFARATTTPVNAFDQQHPLTRSTFSSTTLHHDQPADTQVTSAARIAEPAQIAEVARVASVAHVATPTADVATPEALTASTSAASAERVGRMLDVRDATPARPLSHMTLNLDNANGGTDRIRIDLQGSTVHAAIAVGDHTDAAKMSLRVGQLQHALEQQGLDTGLIRVATAGADTGAGWNQHHNGDDPARPRDRQPATHRDNARQDADDSRQRATRDQNGDK